MSATALTVPLGRQGPGRLPEDVVARLAIRLRRRSAGMLPGDNRTPGAADGLELAQLRPYEAGDDVRRLDPAASARTGVAHVRLQVPERTLTTWIVLDVSASMAFGTQGRLKSDVAEGVVEVVGRLAVRHGGRVALAVAGGERARILAPRGGRQALAGLRALVRAGVQPDASGGGAPLTDALERVARLAGSPGVVVVVSDFRDEGWGAGMRAAATRHTVLAVEVVDRAEAELPDQGVLTLVDPETGRVVEADTGVASLREAYAAAERGRRADVAARIRAAGADHLTLRTDRDWLRDFGRATSRSGRLAA